MSSPIDIARARVYCSLAMGERNRQVLVIDDQEDAAETLAELIAEFGHRATVALNAPAAMAQIRARRPDVILCDIELPGMSGYELARSLRADPTLAAVQLVALSGHARAEDRRHAAEAGFDAHIGKPIDLDLLERFLAGDAHEV
jgi:CheY-like chemotaxis protein